MKLILYVNGIESEVEVCSLIVEIEDNVYNVELRKHGKKERLSIVKYSAAL